MAWLEPTLIVLGYMAVGALCLAGIALACFSFSGTWLIVLAAIVGAFLEKEQPPGAWTVVSYIGISLVIEGIDTLAGIFGVTSRGGSRLAGFAAVGGGFVGLILGSFIPVPVVGSLVGMAAVSFALVFAVERYRLRKTAAAATHIAFGAVVARVLVLFLKVIATLGMTIGLAVMLWR